MLPTIQTSNRRAISGRPSLLYQTSQIKKKWRSEGASLFKCGPAGLVVCLLFTALFGMFGFFYGTAINTLDMGTGIEHVAGAGFRKGNSSLGLQIFAVENKMIHARQQGVGGSLQGTPTAGS
ncbi:hypothetical protein T484DRAFT_1881830 [Baffinella frigidus]|nr:hypothetical protein T484DRAFT_1881830 [Cryptophyta sp. CCMP2293]